MNRIIIVSNKANSRIFKNNEWLWSWTLKVIISIKKLLAFNCLCKIFLKILVLLWIFMWNLFIGWAYFCSLSLILSKCYFYEWFLFGLRVLELGFNGIFLFILILFNSRFFFVLLFLNFHFTIYTTFIGKWVDRNIKNSVRVQFLFW